MLSDAVDAAAPCWGGFVDRATPDAETTDSRPARIVDLAPQLHCPVYLVGGALDTNPSPEVLQQMEQRLSESGQPVTLEVFPDAGHAFLADYRDSYQPEAAADLWPKLVAFFKSNLDG